MRARVFLLVVATTLLAPAAASAKGPSGATVDGDGFDRPVELRLRGEEQWRLVEDLGFFATVFRTEPDPTLDAAPAGDLGPRLVVSWEVPGPSGRSDVVRQDVYPLAPGGPYTYMAPGQPVMGNETYGGWFRAPAGLADDLAAAGIPAPGGDASAAPAATIPSPGDGDGRSWTWAWAGPLAVTAAAGAGGAALVLSRRRAALRA